MKQRPYAVFDIDGTLIRWQLYHAMADTLVKLKAIDPGEYKEVLSARMNWKNRDSSNSFIDYEKALIRLIEKSLPSINHATFHEACNNVVERYRGQVYAYTRELIKKLKQQDYLLFAISASPEELVGEIAKYYGFDDYVGTAYRFENNHYKEHGPTILASAKPKRLAELVKKHHAARKDSVAVGDSAGDIGMLEYAQKAIAFNPSRELFDYAAERHWQIVIERKNMIYKLRHENGQYVLKTAGE